MHCGCESRCLSDGRDDEKVIWCRDFLKRLSESILTVAFGRLIQFDITRLQKCFFVTSNLQLRFCSLYL